VNEVTQLGLEFFAAAFAYGAAEVKLLLAGRRRNDLAALAAQLGLTETVLTGLGFGSGRIGLVETDDPDQLSAALRGGPEREGGRPSAFLPLGDKRNLTKFALRELQAGAPEPVSLLPLAPGAPFGQVVVDTAGCTLCLSCVPACPTGALQDNPDHPALSFIEDACVQCGICKNTCPEQVISLNPRLNFLPEANRAILIKEDEPCLCISCGKPFGTKATVDRIIEKLAGKHWMFGRNDLVDRMRMCADCRIIAQTNSELDPYAGPPRPTVRTTEDYLAAKERG
jgi:ferredoxin